MGAIMVFYRMVGGFFSTNGTFTCRLRWEAWMALMLTISAANHGHGWEACLIVFLGTFFGTFLGRLIPHGFAFDQSKWQNTLWMSLIGLARVSLMFATLAYYMPETLLVMPLGLFQGFCYLIGDRKLKGKDSGFYYFDGAPTMKHSELSDLWIMQSEKEPQVFAKGETEWGEVGTGLFCYELPFWLTFLM